jgi:hypothetical protein
VVLLNGAFIGTEERRQKMNPDPFVLALQGFFERFNYNKVTLKQDDAALIAAFLCEIPPGYEFLRSEFAFGFAQALDVLRREKILRWTN